MSNHIGSPNTRLSVLFVRAIMNSAIFSTLFYDAGFTNMLCGPLLTENKSYLFKYTLILQLTNCLYDLSIFILTNVFRVYFKKRIIRPYFIKYSLLFFIKVWCVASGPNKSMGYYIAVLFFEVLIEVIWLGLDLINNKNIEEVVQLTFIDVIHKLSIFYLITQALCVSFAGYWFISNLIYLVLSQVESYMEISVKYPIYPKSLYTKDDTHRIMIIGFIYFGIFSILQIQRFGYGFLMLLLLIGFPFYQAICKFKQDHLYLTIVYILSVAIGVVGFILTRIWTPWLFKPLSTGNMCINSVTASLQH